MTVSEQHATNATELLKATANVLEIVSGQPGDVILGTANLIAARAQVEATLSVAAAIREQTAQQREIHNLTFTVGAEFDRRLS